MNFNKKSKTTALFLALLLGPIGYMYASFKGGFIMTAVALCLSFTIVVPVLCYLCAVFMATSEVEKHNRNVDMTIALMKGRS